MAGIYTVRFGYAIASAGDVEVLVYRGEPGYSEVIRNISLTCLSATPGLVAIYLRGAGVNRTIYRSGQLGTTTALLELRQVILPGEELFIFAQVVPVEILVTGYRFTTS